MEGSMHTLLTLPFNSRFFGADRHSRRGGRGEKWSGDACVAHGGAGAKQQGNRTPGDPRVPTLPPCHPRPYEANPLPCSFHKIPTLESGRGVEWSGDACVAHGGQGNRTPGDSASIDLRQRQNPILNVYPEEWPETLND